MVETEADLKQNPYKDPRWGRGSETPGEDPFRIMNYVEHLLIGLEGGKNPPLKKMIATCKHFSGYDMEIWYEISEIWLLLSVADFDSGTASFATASMLSSPAKI